MNYETVWTFNTARFAVRLEVAQDFSYQYDGDDEDGETQDALNSGEFVAFDSRVVVELDGVEIGSDSLGGSVYGVNDTADFYEAHRDRDPMKRNSSIMRAAHGGNTSICHYFPDMVASAIAEARAFLKSSPRVRSHG